MATLQSILAVRSPAPTENNLEQGKMFAYSTVADYNTFGGCHCWIAPSAGTVELEVIGAGGSGSRMCCCSSTLPGNSGAYVKRSNMAVDTGCWICMHAGKSCRNGSLCNRGCSEPGQVCWQSAGTNGCICAEGGRSGTSFCSTGTARWCCMSANGFCSTQYGSYCGLICNHCPGAWCACAYGGDSGQNKMGNISCSTYWHCYPNCNCSTTDHVAIPPGYHAADGGVVTYQNEESNGYSEWSGMGFSGYIQALNSMSRMPNTGHSWTECWDGNRICGCYDTQGCTMYVPHGHGGPAAKPCSGVRDNGWAGGDAIIKIRFVAT